MRLPSFTPSRFLPSALTFFMFASLVCAVALLFGWSPSIRYGPHLWKPSPIALLLVSAATAMLRRMSTNGLGSHIRGRLIAFMHSRIGVLSVLSVAVTAILIVFALPPYLASAPYGYPTSDGAVLEIYTIHAARGIWPFGPYSQFGWRHPGPLFFYLLAPLFSVSGYRPIAMHAGAFAINVASLLVILVVLLRRATPILALITIGVLGLYVYRIDGLAGSYWNPHVVVLPVTALIALSARLAAGRASTLPALVFVASFLAQTHVSLVPYVGVLVGAALCAAAVWHSEVDRGVLASSNRLRSLGWWINASAWLMALLWLLPLAEELIHTPGNISTLINFLAEPYQRQSFGTVFAVWGDAISAPMRPDFTTPVGLGVSPQHGFIVAALAFVQVLLLIGCYQRAARRSDRFDAALCGTGALASLVALWSITRIRTSIGDYMVFWMTAIGALNWGIVAGVVATAFVSNRMSRAVRWAAVAAAVAIMVMYVLSGVRQIEGVRQVQQLPDGDRDIMLLSEDLDAYLAREHLGRPLLQVAGAWSEAAGIVLERYRRGAPVAVDANLVWFYGEPLAPSGREDSLFVISDASAHNELSKRPGDIVVAHHGSVFIHTGVRLDD